MKNGGAQTRVLRFGGPPDWRLETTYEVGAAVPPWKGRAVRRAPLGQCTARRSNRAREIQAGVL